MQTNATGNSINVSYRGCEFPIKSGDQTSITFQLQQQFAISFEWMSVGGCFALHTHLALHWMFEMWLRCLKCWFYLFSSFQLTRLTSKSNIYRLQMRHFACTHRKWMCRTWINLIHDLDGNTFKSSTSKTRLNKQTLFLRSIFTFTLYGYTHLRICRH